MIGRARYIILVSAIAALLSTSCPASAEMKATYLYNLSNFTGTVPTSSARVSLDPVTKEVYVITGDLVRIFNTTGMEIYSFGEDLNVGVLADAALDGNGNIYVLSYSYQKKGTSITLCNYRGDPIREIKLTNVPPQLEGFRPNHLIYRNGSLYLASDSDMMAIVTDADGAFKTSIDFYELMGVKEFIAKTGEKKAASRSDLGIAGFFVDHEGNMLFTSPITAVAYVVTPDLKVKSFGRRGSAPGRFAVPRGMARDRFGNYLVSDILRCVVMVFDKDFEFKMEFGYRGFGPSNLIGPTEMVIDDDSNLYITQLRERGISVFNLKSE
jgi:DNA-binding beta-propeller fold protein YncE